MRRTAVRLCVVLATATVLSACGSAGLSSSDGYAIGQSLAATHASLARPAIVRACRHQWSLSGPASDERAPWVLGCVAGAHALDASVRQ